VIYYARLLDGERKVEIEKDGDTYLVTIDGRKYVADARIASGPGAMSIIVDNKCYETIVTNTGRKTLVSTDGDEFEIELADELERRESRYTAHHPGLDIEEIRAPMPGVVVSIEVEQGQEVDPGTPVIIVEAMKMQNELATVVGGAVKEIRVSRGDIVDSQKILVVIERKAA
jgi:acetyl/propionyl-CoA carboxylase alpha subunit